MTQEQVLTEHQKKCADAHYIFLQAAEQLVAKMKSPAAFLLFLTDALNWLHMHGVQNKKYDRNEDSHYNLIVIVENVVIPWFGGGPDMIENIAKGIGEVNDFAGDEGMRRLSNNIIVGFGNYAQGMDFTSMGLREYSTAQSALIDMLDAMEEYDLAIHPEEQKETEDEPSIKDWLLSLGATPTPAALELEKFRAEVEGLKAENEKLKKKTGKVINKDQQLAEVA